MNILIPHSWLTEYLDTNATPEQIAKYLSLSGPSVEKINKMGDDYIYDIEVTTNRVDMMSVMGIAREAATILPNFNFKAKFTNNLYTQLLKIKLNQQKFPLKLKVDSKICPRFSAVVIKDISLKFSPESIAKKLEKSGIRSLNNVIDISNYLMRAYGQPVHVFDLDKIQKSMTLRLSKKGEKITTLDKKTFTLPGNDIVIQDSTNKLIDLCGIMGGLNSAIDVKTKNVLLFVQIYKPKNIRQTSMTLAQRSQASQLFERNLDPELVIPTLKAGIKLFKELANGTLASEIIDIYPNPHQPKQIKTPLQLIKDKLGVDIDHQKVSLILNSLGFTTQYQSKLQLFHITVPSFRNQDVSIPEDIVEEVARIYGYHRIPGLLVSTPIPTNYPDENFNLEDQIKNWLAGFGLNELYTNSMISQQLAKKSGYPINSHLKIKNALSEDWQYLRRSLNPSHLEAIDNNQVSTSVSFFEIANTYHSKPTSLPIEKLELIITTTKSYPHLKGILDVLFRKLYLKVEFKPLTKSAEIYHQNRLLGIIKPLITDLGTTTQVANLNLKPILKLAKTYPTYHPIFTHPPIIEDLTFTLLQNTYLGPVIKTIKASDKLITKVTPTKTYHQNHTFNITYQSYTQPLSDKLITPIRKIIVKNLKNKFSAKLVGKI